MAQRRAKDIPMSPTEMVLVSPSSENIENFGELPNDDGEKPKVQMKKELGLLEGVAIILGIICGSGIFISPKGVIKEVEAVGTSLIIWVLCGFLSMIGALCYAELGTVIPKSGGDYAYILEAFGDMPAFLYLWAATVIFVPTTNAIMGLTFASYVLQPFFPSDCDLPHISMQLLAAATICFLTFINCYDVKTTTKLQNMFMFTKIGAIVIIIIVGVYWMSTGHTSNFDAPFEDTVTDPGKLSVAFYSGIFSYAGWNYLNFMTEELRNPYKNLPRAIFISLPLVTFIYVLANMAYLAVLTRDQMLASNAIAVTFGDIVLNSWAWIIPLLVAISAFGGLSVHIMTSSRMCFVGARNGHMPAMLAHINIAKYSPTPSLVFLCVLSLLMLCVSDVHVLITYCSIVESAFITLTIAGLLWLRYKRPNAPRPIKVPLIIPISFICICVFLLIVPCYVAPYEVGMGVLMTCTGIPVYFSCVLWKNKPVWFQNIVDSLTHTCQKTFLSAREEQE